MYDMYPDDWASDWGPSHHRTDDAQTVRALQVALDLRDNGGERPDDN